MSSKERRPQRTCLGCGARDSQDHLIRLAVADQGRLIVDRNQGRGGYLHRKAECWQMFLGRKSQYRAFHVEITRTTREQLINQLNNG